MFDFKVIDDILLSIGKGVNIIEYNNALGIVDFITKSPIMECSLDKFLLNSIDEANKFLGFFIITIPPYITIHDKNYYFYNQDHLKL